MSGIRDLRKLINVQNMTNGEIVCTLDNDYMTDDSGFFTLTTGQYHLIKTILKLLKDDHDVLIKIGYKTP